MTFGFCHLSIVPLRENPSDTSEMTSQLLFGDVFEVIEKVSPNWIKIRSAFDSYEGYMDPKQQISIDSVDYISAQTPKKVNRRMLEIETKMGKLFIPPACSFGDLKEENDFVLSSNLELDDFEIASRTEIIEMALSFLNAPYLWGGKTPFGVDCSGFTQSVFKMAGKKLPRDASQQVNEGEALSFLEEALPGDLAFFDNEEGNIIHVGVILGNNEIIHASGKVRIDKIDHVGIYNADTKSYSHKLRITKTLL